MNHYVAPIGVKRGRHDAKAAASQGSAEGQWNQTPGNLEPPPQERPINPNGQRIVHRKTHTNVVTLNCQSLKSDVRKNQLSRLLNDLNTHLACLQETRITDPDSQQFTFTVPPPNQTSNSHPTGYTIYAGSADNGYAGCAVAVRNDMAPLVHSWGSPCSRIAFVHFKNVKKPTWVISAYAPTRDAEDTAKEAYYDALRQLLNTVPRSHLLIIGTDANAQFGADKSSPALGRWYYPAEDTNDNGERLLLLAEEYDLCIANTIRRTSRSQRVSWSSGARLSAESKVARRSGRLMSLIDYVLISSRWAPMVEKAGCVQRSVFPSDHQPVTVRMKLRYVAPKSDRCKRYDVQRLTSDAPTRERYQQEVLNRLFPPAERRDVLVNAESFTAAVIAARDAHVPELKAEKKKPLISAEAERLVTKLADARRRNDEQQTVHLRRTLRRQLKRDREELWQRRTEEIEDAWRCNNSKKVYALLRRYSGKLKAASDTLAVDGRCVAGDHCLDAWKDHFSALLNRPPPAGEPLELERLQRYEGVDEGPPTADEVAAAIKQMRSGKAAGEDGVQPELLKALPDMAVTALASIYKSIWDREAMPDQWRRAVVIPLHKKGSTTDPANYRGISLLDLQYKLLERIIANRIVPVRDARTREEQAGFRPGRSTVDQIFVLRRVLETHHRYRKPIEVVFLDFACAFDSPDRERIYQLLESDGVPAKLVRIIREMNTGSEAVVRTRSGCSGPFPVATGVKQGSVIGPLLFNYVIDAIMREASAEFAGGVQLIPSAKVLTDLDYADDLALVSTCRRELQKFTDRVSEKAARFGLRLKPPKCELLTADADEANPATVNGEAIKAVRSFCYLGSIITVDGSVKEDIDQRIRKARAAFTTLSQCLWRTNITHRMKLRVYATAIRPILLYASETWPLTQGEEERLNRAERSFLRRALQIRASDNVSNRELWSKVNTALASSTLTDVGTAIRRNRVKLLGHVLRRKDDRLTRIALEYTGERTWKRRPGGARSTWLEVVRKDVERANIRRLPEFRSTDAVTSWNRGDWLRVAAIIAEDRATWHQIVESSADGKRPRGRAPMDPY